MMNKQKNVEEYKKFKNRRAKQLHYLKWKQIPNVPNNHVDKLEHERRKKAILKQVRQLEEDPKVLTWKSILVKVAAILIALFGAVTFQTDSLEHSIWAQHYVTNDQPKTIWLPDSSTITILPHSAVSYDRNFGKVDRRIHMEGLVKFDIKKDSTRPFIVESESLKVKVLGTSFTIDDRSGNKNKIVNVHRGKVSVSIPTASNTAHHVLTINQRICYNQQTNIMTITNGENPGTSALLRKANVIFRASNIGQLAAILANEYDIAILVDKKLETEGAITAELKDKTLNEILDIVSKVIDIDYHIEDSTLKIKKKNM